VYTVRHYLAGCIKWCVPMLKKKKGSLDAYVGSVDDVKMFSEREHPGRLPTTCMLNVLVCCTCRHPLSSRLRLHTHGPLSFKLDTSDCMTIALRVLTKNAAMFFPITYVTFQ
jgi:hypothetical protein